MEVEAIQTINQTFAAAWQELFERSSSPTPFQSPDWIVPWFEYLAEESPLVVVARNVEKLCAIAPFVIVNSQAPSSEPRARKLLLAGTGASDYLDPLFDHASAAESAHAIFSCFESQAAEWDLCELHQLRPESPLLTSPLNSGIKWTDQILPGEPCPVLSLPEEPDRLDEVIPPRQLDKLRYYRRRAERAGAIRVQTATPENFDVVFDAFLRLHAARITSQQRPTSLAVSAAQRFHRAVAARFLQRGALRLYVMHRDAHPISAFYGFRLGARTFFYLSGLDPAHAELSPGMLIVGHAIEEAAREGCLWFDFLRGQEPYKYHWGAIDSATYQRQIGHAPASLQAEPSRAGVSPH